MNAIKNAASLIGGATLITAAAMSLTSGLVSASAAPAPTQWGTANLWVFEDPANRANYRVTVKGVFHMNEADAYGFIKHMNDDDTPGYMLYQITGDDGREQDISNHQYHGNGPRDGGYLRAESTGINFLQEISVPKGSLNEDTDGVDEVFVEAKFVDADQGVRNAYTNVVTGEF